MSLYMTELFQILLNYIVTSQFKKSFKPIVLNIMVLERYMIARIRYIWSPKEINGQLKELIDYRNLDFWYVLYAFINENFIVCTYTYTWTKHYIVMLLNWQIIHKQQEGNKNSSFLTRKQISIDTG